MRAIGVLVMLVLAGVAFAGCMESRDIGDEAKEREAWARDHNDHAPVGIMSGPARIAPGALVWFSAHGSHDPDFFGARQSDERREASSEGGFHARDNATYIDWSWDIYLDEDRNDGLGNGIRLYEWSIDGGPALVAHELTHRYGSLDGPVRFPVGFNTTGTHTVTLRIVDWSGDTDTVTQTIEIVDGGTPSTVVGWSVTEQGWVHERTIPVSFEQYGECPTLSRGHYDAKVHHMAVPWDLFFFSQTLQVEAAWDRLELPTKAHPVSAPGLPLGLNGPTPETAPPWPAVNLNDVGVTLGHCENGGSWAVFDTDQDLLAEDLVERGEVTGEEAVRHIEITGTKTERQAEYDLNVYLSDTGDARWGKGGDVRLRTILTPATDTSYGGQ